MVTSHKTHAFPKTYLVLLFLLGSLLLQPLSHAAADAPEITRSAVVTITGKTSDAVMVSERSFPVTDATVLFDEKKQRISLDDLPVPCSAQVRYQLRMDKSPLCLEIQVKKKMKGATKYWSSSDKEGSK
jgi:hypothetical protein